MRLILASASPRRAELLRAAGFEFDIVPAHVDESRLDDEEPADYVSRIARVKAQAAPADLPDDVVIGADTVVVIGSQVLGKPRDQEEAERMLGLLAGRTHEVFTGVALRNASGIVSSVERTRVHFLPLSYGEIVAYIAGGEPYGKAGAYAIQGQASRFVDWIEGSYSNVVGLPVATVYRLLRELVYGRE
jgi:septum formation protein